MALAHKQRRLLDEARRDLDEAFPSAFIRGPAVVGRRRRNRVIMQGAGHVLRKCAGRTFTPGP
jgi:hypothetical protein